MLFSEPKIPQYDRAFNEAVTMMQFQCSSASRKFLNLHKAPLNSIVVPVSVLFSEPKIPQCSARRLSTPEASVSVLFSEPKIPQLKRPVVGHNGLHGVSVLFSEPKIPQSNGIEEKSSRSTVSVLFSEPKIPQSSDRMMGCTPGASFSALQRAENSSIDAWSACAVG